MNVSCALADMKYLGVIWRFGNAALGINVEVLRQSSV
jgi:hypothetical protein